MSPKLYRRCLLLYYIYRGCLLLYNLIQILKIFLIGCKIKHYLAILQTFFKKNSIFPFFLQENRISIPSFPYFSRIILLFPLRDF